MNIKEQAWAVAQAMEGWCGRDRMEKLVELVTEYQPKCIVELGVYGGKSLIPMAMAAQQYNGYALGIDPWTNEANLEGELNEHTQWWREHDLEAVYSRFMQAIPPLGLTYACRWLRMRGEDALPLFPDGSIDLFSLDGNHSELASTRDVQLWLPKVAAGGHLVMDDTSWTSMQKAVGLVKAAGFSVVHAGGGWTVFRR